jgi:hypothetical protein
MSPLPDGFHLVDPFDDGDVDPYAELIGWEVEAPHLSQDPLFNERPSFDQDAYYDGTAEL